MAATPKTDAYKDTNFIRHVMSLVGRQVSVSLCNGGVCRGVLRTFSSDLDFVLTCAQMMKGDVVISREETQTFPLSSVVTLSAHNIRTSNTEDGEGRLLTDGDIGLARSKSRQRELQRFGLEDQVLGIDESLDMGGWDSEDMLNTNERKFGVQSTYSSDLKGYTTQLTATDTEEFASRQQKADRLAKEIVTGAEVELSTQLDEEASEEDKYSAVVRPGKSDELPPMVEEKETQPLPLEDTAEESPGTARGDLDATGPDSEATAEDTAEPVEDPLKDVVKKSTLNPNAKSFTPSFQLQHTPVSPSHTTPHQAVSGGGAGASGRQRRHRGESSGSQASPPHSYGSPSVVQVISPPPQQPHGMMVPGQAAIPHIPPMFQPMQQPVPLVYVPQGHFPVPRSPSAQPGVQYVRVPHSHHHHQPGGMNYMPHHTHQIGFPPPPPR